jgi:hypothetical protein
MLSTIADILDVHSNLQTDDETPPHTLVCCACSCNVVKCDNLSFPHTFTCELLGVTASPSLTLF